MTSLILRIDFLLQKSFDMVGYTSNLYPKQPVK